MRVFGVDFTSAPGRSKPIVLCHCELADDQLSVSHLDSLTSLDAFGAFLKTPGPWVAGLDFPFGQPRRLITNLGWPNIWADYVSQVGEWTRDRFRAVLEDYKRDRPDGDREHFRLTDVLTGGQSPSKLYGVPVALMFYEGAPRLVSSDASIVPVRQNDSNKIIVESYPALVARALVGAEKYKPSEGGEAQDAALRVRQEMVTRLSGGTLKSGYGITVKLSDEVRGACIKDWQGDSIDSVFAAIQAAWAWRRRDSGFGVPEDCDLGEGWIVDPVTQPSVNSSITRVRPVFQRLFASDTTGASWLPVLLRMSATNAISNDVMRSPGRLLEGCRSKRSYNDRLLGPIELEDCFEHSVAPGHGFLRWLITHPDQMSWPGTTASPLKYSPQTQQHRESLVGKHGAEAQTAAVNSALGSLDRQGVERSGKQWWAFEGFTEVDCFLETDRLVLLIEGKRTESLSESTAWYRGRNQLHRNLEAARDLAGGREYGVMILSEEPVADDTLGNAVIGLPHLTPDERAELMTHYLGFVTWRQLIEATGNDFGTLPKNVARRVRRVG